MKKIKVVIVGAGSMATKYLEVLSSNKKIKIEGIYSRTFSRAESLKKKFKIRKNLTSIASLYEETNADIVIVTVPGDHMLKTCIQLLKFPWLIFIEKPPGINFSEYTKLISLSNLKNKKIYVGMNRRYFSSTLNLIKKIKNIKEPRSIQIYDQQDTKIARKKGKSKKLVSNWMYANSIHLIDYISFLTRGKIKDIKFIKRTKDEINCYIKFSSKDVVNYICRWNKPGPWQVKVSTKKYYFEMSPLETLRIKSDFNKKNKILEISNVDKKFKTGIKLQIDDLIKVFLKKKNNLVDLKKMYKTMNLIKKIYLR